MADVISVLFKNKKVNLSKLEPYGFKKKDTGFVYEKTLLESGFKLIVNITMQGKITTQVFDPSFNEPYILHLVEGSAGSFVGKIKLQYEETLAEIADHCFEDDIFKSVQAKALIDYVKNTYVDELEFLWKKFPNNAIWRRKDSGKWYGALLTVSKRKLGLDSDEVIEIIDLRIKPEEVTSLIDGVKYFPGYHMNKKSWYTICLDGSVPVREICERIDESYMLAK